MQISVKEQNEEIAHIKLGTTCVNECGAKILVRDYHLFKMKFDKNIIQMFKLDSPSV